MDRSKVFLTSTGCFIVQTKTNHIAAYLKNNNYDLVNTAPEAEAIIITTCAVTEGAAEGTRKKILECIEKRRAHVPVYVVGCYSRVEKDCMKDLANYGETYAIPEIKDIEKEFLGVTTWDSTEYNNFFSYPFREQYLESASDSEEMRHKILKRFFRIMDSILKKDMQFLYLFGVGHLYSPDVQRAIWPVICSKGCTHACSYCAVRIGTGRYASKPLVPILDEVKRGVKRGYRRALLIGDELGPYGVDLKDGTSLSTLLDALASGEYPIQLGLWYLDAFHLMDVLPAVERLAQEKELFFLGITVQHGSKRILDLMNRHYSVSDTMDAIVALRKHPKMLIATQIMVGFPSETEEDFLESYRLVERGCFDKVEVFEYSPRPGTRAAEMSNDVPADVKRERAERLRRLAARKAKRLFARKIMNELF